MFKKNCSNNDNGNIYTYLNKFISQYPIGYIPVGNNSCVYTQQENIDINTMISTILDADLNTYSGVKAEYELETNFETEIKIDGLSY